MKSLNLLDEDKIKSVKVYGCALLFAFIVGFSFLGVKTCVQLATPAETLVYRFNFAAFAALVILFIKSYRKEIKQSMRMNLVLTAGFYLAFMALQVVGLLYATSIESGIIFAIIPILTKIIAYIFLGESGTWKQNLFVGLTVMAVIIMVVMGAQGIQNVSFIGIVLLFLSSLAMAISNVFMRYVRNEYSPFSIAFYISVGGCVIFNIAAFILKLIEDNPTGYFEPLKHWQFITATAFLGILSTMASSLLMAYILKHIEAVKATIFGNLSTAISIVIGVLILKEPLFLYQLVCTALIIVGVVGTSVTGSNIKIGDKEV